MGEGSECRPRPSGISGRRGDVSSRKSFSHAALTDAGSGRETLLKTGFGLHVAVR